MGIPAANGYRPHLLVIDNDAMVLALFRDLLEDEGYQVSLQSTVDRDLGVVGHLAPDLIILEDLWADEDHGWSSLEMLRMDPGTATIPFVLCTGAVTEVVALQPHLEEMGIRIVIKPFHLDQLLAVIADALAPAGEPAAASVSSGGGA